MAKKPRIFPKNAKVGDRKTVTRTVKGKRRKITFEKTKPHDKNRNLDKKIISNKPA